MTTTTMERINELTQERAELYRQASNGRRGDTAVMLQVHKLDEELQKLWEVRRQERAGRAEGIDALIERSYEETYGQGFEDSISPPAVAEPEDEKRMAVAA